MIEEEIKEDPHMRESEDESEIKEDSHMGESALGFFLNRCMSNGGRFTRSELKDVVSGLGYDSALVNKNLIFLEMSHSVSELLNNDFLTKDYLHALLKRMFSKSEVHYRILYNENNEKDEERKFHEETGTLHPNFISYCVTFLIQYHLLTAENFFDLMDIKTKLRPIVLGLKALERAARQSRNDDQQILNQKVLDSLIKNHDVAFELGVGITTLYKHDLFGTDNRQNFLRVIAEFGVQNSRRFMLALEMFGTGHVRSLPLTQENFSFLLKKEFADCSITVLRSMDILYREGKLDEKTREKLFKNPYKAIVLARRHDPSPRTYNRSALDEVIDELSIIACTLGLLREDDKSLCFGFTPDLLAIIAPMAMKMDFLKENLIDPETAKQIALDVIEEGDRKDIIGRYHYLNHLEKFGQSSVIKWVSFKVKTRKLAYFLWFFLGIFFMSVFSWALVRQLKPSLLNSPIYVWVGVVLAVVTATVFIFFMYRLYQLKKIEDAFLLKNSLVLNIAGLFFGVFGCGVLTSSLLLSRIGGSAKVKTVLSHVSLFCFVLTTVLLCIERYLRHRAKSTKYLSWGVAFNGLRCLGAVSLFSGGFVDAGKRMGDQSKAIFGWAIVGGLCLGIIGAVGIIGKDT